MAGGPTCRQADIALYRDPRQRRHLRRDCANRPEQGAPPETAPKSADLALEEGQAAAAKVRSPPRRTERPRGRRRARSGAPGAAPAPARRRGTARHPRPPWRRDSQTRASSRRSPPASPVAGSCRSRCRSRIRTRRPQRTARQVPAPLAARQRGGGAGRLRRALPLTRSRRRRRPPSTVGPAASRPASSSTSRPRRAVAQETVSAIKSVAWPDAGVVDGHVGSGAPFRRNPKPRRSGTAADRARRDHMERSLRTDTLPQHAENIDARPELRRRPLEET